MKMGKPCKTDMEYVKTRTGPRPDSKKPINPKKPKTRSK
jgi:hypothetical protein